MDTPFIKLSLFFAVGILAGFYFEPFIQLLFLFLLIALVVFVLVFLQARKLFLEDICFGTSSFIILFLLGALTSTLHLPQHQERHYINHLPSKEPQQEVLAEVIIREQLKPDLYNEKYIAEISTLHGKKVKGKVLLLFSKAEGHQISVDDQLLISSKLTPFPPPLNPHQFDYRKFMNNRGVLMQSTIRSGNYRKLAPHTRTIKGAAHLLRSELTSKLERNGFQGEELAIIQALLLGQRNDIPAEIYESYSAAGVIHILAVSGLHVGIILMLLNWALSPLRFFVHGTFFRFLFLLIFLWSFAVIAGLSPSVVRAVTMFSFVGFGMQLKRRTNVLNTLFISFFLLLLIRPQNLFEVGFQLSYTAVLSIILFQPLLSRLWQPRIRVVNYFWKLSTVTIAAQAGVFPLSLFYFHQFPGLFLISNLAILPFLGFVLISGLGILLLALLEFLPRIMVEAYVEIIGIINRMVEWIARQEAFLFDGIPFSWNQTLAVYLLLIALFHFMRRKTPQYLILLLVCVLLVQGSFIGEDVRRSSTEFVVFHKNRNTVLGAKKTGELKLYHNLSSSPDDFSVVKNYFVGERINHSETTELANIYYPEKGFLLVVDSIGIYEVPDFSPTYVLLSNSPKINLERMLQVIHPRQIIADGSNYPSYVTRWRKTSSERDIPFHYTAKDGAFTLTLAEIK